MNIRKDGFRNEVLIVVPRSIQQQMAQNKITSQLYLTDIGYFPEAPQHLVCRPHGSPEYIFIYCHSGSGWFKLKGEKKIKVSPGEFFTLPANTTHSYGSSKVNRWSIYWIHFSGTQAHTFYEYLSLGLMAKTHPATNFNLDLFRKVMLDLEKVLSFTNCAQSSMALWTLLGDLIYQKQSQQNISIENAMSFMSSNLHKSLSINDIAAHVGLTPVRLSKLFKEQYSTTPIDHLIHLRIQRACKYLQLTDMKIHKIAQIVGYTDQYYFSRIFSKFIGQSPSKYRAIHKN